MPTCGLTTTFNPGFLLFTACPVNVTKLLPKRCALYPIKIKKAALIEKNSLKYGHIYSVLPFWETIVF
jgi:hypothetical protein